MTEQAKTDDVEVSEHLMSSAAPKTVREASAIIHEFSLPFPNQESFMIVAKLEGNAFKNALGKLKLHGKETPEADMVYLKSVLWYSSDVARETLAMLGYAVLPVEKMIDLAKIHGMKVIRAARALEKEGNQEAKVFLDSLFQKTETGSTQEKFSYPAGSRNQGGAGQFTPLSNNERPSAATSLASPESDREFHSEHVYGASAALCFSTDKTRKQHHTVRLDAALSTAAKDYDWDRKIAIQMTRKELILVLAALMGFLVKVEFAAHGEDNTKGFRIEKQKGHHFISVFAKGEQSRGVQLTQNDFFQIVSLLIRQINLNNPHLTSDSIIVLARQTAQLYSAT